MSAHKYKIIVTSSNVYGKTTNSYVRYFESKKSIDRFLKIMYKSKVKKVNNYNYQGLFGNLMIDCIVEKVY